MIKIAPSILSADFANLADDIHMVEQAGADFIHIDVMDGQFVPNLTFGPPIIAAIRRVTQLPFDVHLMINQPETLLDSFVTAGADIVTVHAEATAHLHRLIYAIKEKGCKAGVSLNPATPLTAIEDVLADLDMVLIMSVNPGFGGQRFISSAVNKIERLKKLGEEKGLSFDIEVDGGINEQTSSLVRAAGANILVAGSAVFSAVDMKEMILRLRGKSA